MKFLGIPKIQYFDGNGDPLNGGKLHTYKPGTSTEKATYPTISDAKAGTNANANPVVLDSRGEATVVLTGSTKLVLKDADDNTIWTVDSVDDDGTVLDENGNILLEYAVVSSAVNYLNISNAATGNGPEIEAKGDDANIDVEIKPKGTGVLVVEGTADTAAEIRLKEDTDNGSNYLGIKPPAAITSSVSFILPDGAGTNGQVLSTDGTDTLSWSDTKDGLDGATITSVSAATDDKVLIQDTSDSDNIKTVTTQDIANLGTGKIVQYVTATSSTDDSSTSTSLANSSLTANITPTSTSNKILVVVSATVSSAGDGANSTTNRFVKTDIRRTSGTATTLTEGRSGSILASGSTGFTIYETLGLRATETAPAETVQTYVLRFANGTTNGTAKIEGATLGPAMMIIYELAV